jgi:putative tricarboxylic transport membrane protein
MRVNDAVSGAVFVILGGTLIQQAARLPGFPGQKYGPDLFPTILGVGLVACGLGLVIRGVRLKLSGAPWVYHQDWMKERRAFANVLAFIVAIVAYIFLSEPIGFIPVAFSIMVALFLWFQVAWHRAVLVSAAMTLGFFWFFDKLFRIPLPRGLLTTIL